MLAAGTANLVTSASTSSTLVMPVLVPEELTTPYFQFSGGPMLRGGRGGGLTKQSTTLWSRL